MQVSSLAWTQTSTPAFQYFYRSDGRLTHERFNHLSDAARNFTWSYTSAGRSINTTDPYLNSAHSDTYDANGRVQSYSLDAGLYSSIQYDDENEMTSWTDNAGSSNEVVPLTYDVRGEVVAFGTGTPYNPLIV